MKQEERGKVSLKGAGGGGHGLEGKPSFLYVRTTRSRAASSDEKGGKGGEERVKASRLGWRMSTELLDPTKVSKRRKGRGTLDKPS